MPPTGTSVPGKAEKKSVEEGEELLIAYWLTLIGLLPIGRTTAMTVGLGRVDSGVG
jgi:hypothetical protein